MAEPPKAAPATETQLELMLENDGYALIDSHVGGGPLIYGEPKGPRPPHFDHPGEPPQPEPAPVDQELHGFFGGGDGEPQWPSGPELPSDAGKKP